MTNPNLNLENVNKQLDDFQAKEEEKIKNTTKWGGDDSKPLKVGDIVAGEVESVEYGKSEKTAHVLFITIRGKASIDGLNQEGLFSVLANAVLRKKVDTKEIDIGKSIAIKYLGEKESAKWKKKYKNYLVMPI